MQLLILVKRPEFACITMILVLSLAFNWINPAFLGMPNLQAMLRASAYIGIPTVGLALCLISGMIDISIGSLIGLVSCVISWLIIFGGVDPLVAMGLGIGMGALSSGFAAFSIIAMHLNPFIATLALSFVLKGLSYVVSGGYDIYPLPGILTDMGNLDWNGLTLAMIIMILAGLLASYFLHGTVWGLTVRATGSDREVAKCTEVNPNRVNYVCFIALGILSAITGILISLRVSGGSPYAGLGMEFRAIVACAVGGVSLFGYEGSIVGALLGVFLTQVIANGLIAIGMPAAYQDVALGLILLAIIAIDLWRQNVKLPLREVE